MDKGSQASEIAAIMAQMAQMAQNVEGEGDSPLAGLIAAIMVQNKQDIIDSLPTWELMDRAEKAAYRRGLRDGYWKARHEIQERLFGDDYGEEQDYE